MPNSADNPTPDAATLEYLDPNTVEIGDNVRDNATEGPEYAELLSTVKEMGILVPLTAVRAADGTVTIREGQRRTLAARELGLSTIPVFVRDDTAADDQTRTQHRVVEQIVTNRYRKGLTERQHVNGIQELLMAGLTPTKVAKALSVPKKVVAAAAEAAKSKVALEALDTTQLTIEQAAQLVEFENDPDAAAELMAATTDAQFERTLADLRQRAAENAARAEAAIPFREKGFTILQRRPNWNDELNGCATFQLCDANGTSADDLEITDPGHWAVWLDEVEVYVDSRSGEVVHELKIDWSLDADDHEATPEEGLIHPRYIEDGSSWEPTYYCLDLAAAGLMRWGEYNRQRNAGGQPSTAQDAAAREEAAKREKRKVIKLNKLGLAAQEYRRTWVKDKLLSRKTPPKGAAIFIATQLAAHTHLLTTNGTKEVARELLGLTDHAPIAKSVTDLPPTGDGRATVILLGLVLAALEANTPKDAWRHNSTYTKNYLEFLTANGYELSDIEKVMTKELKADELYDQIDSAAREAEKVA
ncbi:hypothetical protein EB74_16970 [Mycobacterium sp. SWH-M5]|nr:hypothetical protein EB74_16970 [Mycobacterium sp. SWH-M5]